MKKIFFCLLFLFLALGLNAANWTNYPQVSAPNPTDTFLIGTTTTNQQFSASNLSRWLGTNLTLKSDALLTNLFIYGTGTNALRINSGVITSSLPAIDISQTWSNSGVGFVLLNASITNTASSSFATLFDFKVGGQTVLGARATGLLSTHGDMTGAQAGWFKSAASLLYGGPLAFASTYAVGGDAFIYRDAAATLQLGADAATTTAQTIKAHDGNGTDKAGADLSIAGGQGTGAGVGGNVILRTATAGASGSSLNIYSNRVVIGQDGGVTINPSLTNALQINSGVITSSLPAIDISQTWSNSGTTFTALKMNVTDSNSASGSKLLDLQVGGSSKVAFTKTPSLMIGDLTLSVPGINGQFSGVGGNFAAIGNFGMSLTGIKFVNYNNLVWSSGGQFNDPNDLFIGRDAAATFQLGLDAATTTAQTIKAHDGSGTNIAGADLTLAGGQGTGTNLGGSLIFKTAAAGTASTNTLNVYSNRLIIDANGAVTINPTTTNAPELTINSGVITSSAPAIDISQTWSNSGVTFEAARVYVTNNASGNESILLAGYFVSNSVVTTNFMFQRNGDLILRSQSDSVQPTIRLESHNEKELGYIAHYNRVLTLAGSGANNTGVRVVNDTFWLGNSSFPTFVESSGVLQFGLDAATTTAQTIKAHDGNGTDKAGADLSIAGGQGTGAAAGGRIILKTAAAGSSGSSLNNYSERMTILPNGFVGIGTTNPTAGLHILDTVAGGVRLSGLLLENGENSNLPTNSIKFNTGGVTAGIVHNRINSVGGGRLDLVAGAFNFLSNGGTNNGNVGINTTFASERLDVNGNVAISTNLYVTNSIFAKNVIYSPVALASPASTITIDLAGGSMQYVTMTNDTTITVTNAAAGRNVSVFFVGPTNNQFKLVMPSSIRLYSGAVTNTITTNKSAVVSFTSFDGIATNLVTTIAIEP